MDFTLFIPLAIVIIANLLVPKISTKQIVVPPRYTRSSANAPVDVAALQDWLDKFENMQKKN
jgi:hypothetical protein